jgi:hypothetical protein
MRERGVGAAEHHGLADAGDVRRHGVDLGGADGAEKTHDVGVGGEPAERQHNAGVGGLVVLDDQLDLLAEHAAGGVHVGDGQPGGVQLDTADIGGGAGER